MRNIVGFLGRLATSLLIAFILEGVMTMGAALKYQNYSPLAWIFQTLVFIITVWIATEWYHADKKT